MYKQDAKKLSKRVTDWKKVCQRGSGAESRARMVKAKFQSNSELERAKVSQRDFPQTFPFD